MNFKIAILDNDLVYPQSYLPSDTTISPDGTELVCGTLHFVAPEGTTFASLRNAGKNDPLFPYAGSVEYIEENGQLESYDSEDEKVKEKKSEDKDK
jgi:hypothetical protein